MHIVARMQGEIEWLRRRLAEQLRTHRPSTWSRELLAVIVNAIEIEFRGTGSGIEVEARPNLTIIR